MLREGLRRLPERAPGHLGPGRVPEVLSRQVLLSSLLLHTSSYWLAHAAIHQVKIDAVLAHILLLTAMTQESGIACAFDYERRLHAKLIDKSLHNEFYCLDEAIRTTDKDIVNEIRHSETARVAASSRQPRPPRQSTGQNGGIAETPRTETRKKRIRLEPNSEYAKLAEATQEGGQG